MRNNAEIMRYIWYLSECVKNVYALEKLSDDTQDLREKVIKLALKNIKRVLEDGDEE